MTDSLKERLASPIDVCEPIGLALDKVMRERAEALARIEELEGELKVTNKGYDIVCDALKDAQATIAKLEAHEKPCERKSHKWGSTEIRGNEGAKWPTETRCEDTDEVVGHGFLHVEQMDAKRYWASFETCNGRVTMWFTSDKPIRLSAEFTEERP